MSADIPEYYIDTKMLDSIQRELADFGYWALKTLEREGCFQTDMALTHWELTAVARPMIRDAERLGLIVKSSSLED